MAKHPNLEPLEKFFKKERPFQLTDAEYERLTGTPLPKGKYYLTTQSALAKKCKENGYIIKRVIEKTIIIEKEA